jgi:hypothetical protein
MNEVVINGKKLSWNNPEEILGMGGPWIGELILDQTKISNNSVVGNFLFDGKTDRIYFVKYNRISKWAKDNFFSIHYYNLNSGKLAMLDKAYQKVYLESIEETGLVIFNAFHNKNALQRTSIYLSKE